jgi:hypothetical protein
MTTLRVFVLFCAGFTMVLGASAAGCSSNPSGPQGSALGESCAKTADCQSGLVCVANACLGPGGRLVVEEAGTESGVDGSVIEGGVDAGGPEPRLSQIGETCQTARDCALGLACVPSAGGAGVCDVTSYGVAASGKTCSGECGAAADCCELPVGVTLAGSNDAGFFVSVVNCQDILQVILGGNASICASRPQPGSALATGCFFYQTYCSCAADTWACSSGRCVYTASCQANLANTLTGCPSLTRTRASLNTTCDMPANKCHSTVSGCATDTDCNGASVADLNGVTCRGGDCTCSAGGCYLTCAKDLNCQGGYSCDATKKLCVPSPCSSDAQCFSQLGKARAKCQNGACGIPCMVDRDCSPSGDIAGQPFNGTVCGPNHVCAPVGCTSDADCSGTGGARLFCTTPNVTNVHSAISN